MTIKQKKLKFFKEYVTLCKKYNLRLVVGQIYDRHDDPEIEIVDIDGKYLSICDDYYFNFDNLTYTS